MTLVRHWWVIGAVLALAGVAAWKLVWQAPPVWRASSLILVENGAAAPGVAGGIGATADDFTGAQAELLTSAPILAEALGGPEVAAERVAALTEGAPSPLMWLRKELDVRPSRDDGTILVSLDSHDVDAACELVNALVRAFRSFHEERLESSSSASFARLLAEEERLQGEYTAKLEEQRTYRAERGAADAGKLLDVVWSQWQLLKQDLLAAESAASEAQVAWEKARELADEPTLLRYVMTTLTAQPPPASSEDQIRALREKRTGASGT